MHKVKTPNPNFIPLGEYLRPEKVNMEIVCYMVQTNGKPTSTSLSKSSDKARTDASDAEPINDSSQHIVHELTTTAIGNTLVSGVPISTGVIQVKFDTLIDLLWKAQSQQSEMSKLSNESLRLLMSTTEAVSEKA